MHVIMLSGRVGSDPQVKKLGDNTIANFNVAVSDRTNDGGEWRDVTVWYRCTVFGRDAERAEKILHTGSVVSVYGTPSVDTFEGRDGRPRSQNQVRVREFKLEASPARQTSTDDLPI